ncbi:hypothetical protein AC579_5305 [Pseudocercospora musae]|uniref:Heterokaryon incompatibility domain-containing protein n=1 Tax=Pseudocercospora musae TaxID=113226 RepID=A0A139H6U3_9PEZI|nr:hypothetical protein AC579_5305 [Pseudocercospora musae]
MTSVWDLSSRQGVKTGQLPKLQDARKEVRLLRFRDVQDDDHIACDYAVHHLGGKLDYIAISYTWGDVSMRKDVEIEGRIVNVHRNCFDALWQARHCYPEILGERRFFWIDALCIDQSDKAEKSLQVQAMSLIFGRAHLVAISLGPADDMTNMLDRELRNLDSQARQRESKDVEAGQRFGLSHEAYIGWGFSKRTEERKARLMTSYTALANRPYWSRLWIIQELSAAAQIDLLFGAIKYSWEWLEQFHLDRLLEKRTPMGRAIPLVVGAQKASHAWAGTVLPLDTLTDTLEGYRFLLCSNPMDRIYAVLSMMEQPNGLPPLDIDYNKSTLQLAMDCICHFMHSNDQAEIVWLSAIGRATLFLFEGLQISDDDKEWIRIIDQLKDASGQVARDRRDDDLADTTMYGTQSIVGFAGQRGEECYAIGHSTSADPSPILMNAHIRKSLFENKHWPLLDRLPIDSEHVYIKTRSAVVAIACLGTTAGDILVPVETGDHRTDYFLGLVLREINDNQCRIVGRALMHPGLTTCSAAKSRKEACTKCARDDRLLDKRLRLIFDVREWMLLIGQHSIPRAKTPSEPLRELEAFMFQQSHAVIEQDPQTDSTSDDPTELSGTAFWSQIKITDVVTTE